MADDVESQGGDGSDEDLLEIAEEAGGEALSILFDSCSNEGMYAMAEMIADAIQEQVENMADMQAPEIDGMYAAIAGVHSADTAYDCMSAGIEGAYSALMGGWEDIVAHEAAEGVEL